jgi:hypothetical protein
VPASFQNETMTVTYRPRQLLVLRHFQGTVLPEVWRMCAFTCALAYCLCHVYKDDHRNLPSSSFHAASSLVMRFP